MEELCLDKAEALVDRNGVFLNLDALNHLEVDDIVRISYSFPQWDDDPDKFNSDAPYVRIVDFRDQEIIGEILNLNHTESENVYPVRAGERIWFERQHIFEINTEKLKEERRKKIEEFIIQPISHVRITGITFLLDHPS